MRPNCSFINSNNNKIAGKYNLASIDLNWDEIWRGIRWPIINWNLLNIIKKAGTLHANDAPRVSQSETTIDEHKFQHFAFVCRFIFRLAVDIWTFIIIIAISIRWYVYCSPFFSPLVLTLMWNFSWFYALFFVVVAVHILYFHTWPLKFVQKKSKLHNCDLVRSCESLYCITVSRLSAIGYTIFFVIFFHRIKFAKLFTFLCFWIKSKCIFSFCMPLRECRHTNARQLNNSMVRHTIIITRSDVGFRCFIGICLSVCVCVCVLFFFLFHTK